MEDFLEQQLAIGIQQCDRADETAIEHGVDDGFRQHLVVVEQGTLQHQAECRDGRLQVGRHLIEDGLPYRGDLQHEQQDGTYGEQD
ncbi:hypothetical protein D3C75_978210 [compost metagenome]